MEWTGCIQSQNLVAPHGIGQVLDLELLSAFFMSRHHFPRPSSMSEECRKNLPPLPSPTCQKVISGGMCDCVEIFDVQRGVWG